MADFKKQIKQMWIKGMETVGNTASNIANNTKYKVDEMNLQNRRRDLFSNIGPQAYILWQKGEKFPEEICNMLVEIQKLDEQLNDMRAERYAGKEKNEPAATEAENPSENETATAEATAEKASEDGDTASRANETTDSSAQGLSDAAIHQSIDSLFDEGHTVSQLAGKVNDSLDKMDEHMKKYSGNDSAGEDKE